MHQAFYRPTHHSTRTLTMAINSNVFCLVINCYCSAGCRAGAYNGETLEHRPRRNNLQEETSFWYLLSTGHSANCFLLGHLFMTVVGCKQTSCGSLRKKLM